MANELVALREFIADNIGYDGEIDPDVDLLENGILDSFNVVEVAMFVQQQFGIELQGEDVTRENFAKLSTMISLIRMRRADG